MMITLSEVAVNQARPGVISTTSHGRRAGAGQCLMVDGDGAVQAAAADDLQARAGAGREVLKHGLVPPFELRPPAQASPPATAAAIRGETLMAPAN